MSIPQLVKIPLIIVGVIVLLALLSKWCVQDKVPKKQSQQIASILENAGQWHVASNQDQNPVVALVHASYALASARSLQHLAPEQHIAKLTGTNVGELVRHLEREQQDAMHAIFQSCPSLRPDAAFSSVSGWV